MHVYVYRHIYIYTYIYRFYNIHIWWLPIIYTMDSIIVYIIDGVRRAMRLCIGSSDYGLHNGPSN